MGKTTINVTEIDSGNTTVKTKKTTKQKAVASKELAPPKSEAVLAIPEKINNPEIVADGAVTDSSVAEESEAAETTEPPKTSETPKVTKEKKTTKKSEKVTEKAEDTMAETPSEQAKVPIEPKVSKKTPKKIPVTAVADNTSAKGKTSRKKSAKIASQPEPMKLPLFRRIYVKVGYVLGALIVTTLVVFFGRVAIWEHDYIDRMEGSERDTTDDSLPIDTEEETDNTEPTEVEIQEYHVAADRPRYLSIPTIGVYNSRVVEVGVKANGEMATPYNIYDSGWYVNSALPGDNGVSLINGHGGAPGVGIFGNLPQVKPGTEIKIEMGDGRIFTYRVVDTATPALGDEANQYMSDFAFTSPEPGVPSLTLVTCTGDYWLSGRTYSHRFFTRAVLVQ